MENTTNVFTDGIISDMHPLTTQETQLTDALNATFITYNGNEMILLNDMGNTPILDSTTGSVMQLSEGFVPTGIKEYGGILYITSVNKEGFGEIGTIPSPLIRQLWTGTYFFKSGFNILENFTESEYTINTTTATTNITLFDHFNPILLNRTLKCGDCFCIVLPLEVEEINGHPLFSTFDAYGNCNYDGWYNINLKAQISGAEEIAIIPTVFYKTYKSGSYRWYKILDEDVKRDEYLTYPNIKSGNLKIYVTLNIPRDIKFTIKKESNKDKTLNLIYSYNKSSPVEFAKAEIKCNNNYTSNLSEFDSVTLSKKLGVSGNYCGILPLRKGALPQFVEFKLQDDSNKTLEATLTLTYTILSNNLNNNKLLVPLGIYKIKYNPDFEIAEEVELVPANLEVQYYDARDLNSTIYNDLKSAELIKDHSEYEPLHVHLGVAYEDDGNKITDAAFIPGAVWIDQSEKTLFIEGFNLNENFAYYTRSQSVDGKNYIDDIISRSSRLMEEEYDWNGYTRTGLTKILEQQNLTKANVITNIVWKYLLNQTLFESDKILSNTGSLVERNNNVLNIEKMPDFVGTTGWMGTKTASNALLMLYLWLSSDFGVYANGKGHWSSTDTPYPKDYDSRLIPSKGDAVLNHGTFFNGDINGVHQVRTSDSCLFYRTNAFDNDPVEDVATKNIKIFNLQNHVGGSEFLFPKAQVSVRSPYNRILFYCNNGATSMFSNDSLTDGEVYVKNPVNKSFDLDFKNATNKNKIFGFDVSSDFSSIKLKYDDDDTEQLVVEFLNLDLKYDYSKTPKINRSNYKIIPLFTFLDKKTRRPTNIGGGVVKDIDFDNGWELIVNEGANNISFARTLLPNSYGDFNGNKTYHLSKVGNPTKGNYVVIINGFACQINTKASVIKSTAGVGLGILVVKIDNILSVVDEWIVEASVDENGKPIADAYIRNIGIYKVPDSFKDGTYVLNGDWNYNHINNKDMTLTVPQAICYYDGLYCFTKAYNFTHYPDSPRYTVANVWWSFGDLNRSSVIFYEYAGNKFKLKATDKLKKWAENITKMNQS